MSATDAWVTADMTVTRVPVVREQFGWNIAVSDEVHSTRVQEFVRARIARCTERFERMGYAVYGLNTEAYSENGTIVFRVTGWRHLDGRPTEVDQQVRADCRIPPGYPY